MISRPVSPPELNCGLSDRRPAKRHSRGRSESSDMVLVSSMNWPVTKRQTIGLPRSNAWTRATGGGARSGIVRPKNSAAETTHFGPIVSPLADWGSHWIPIMSLREGACSLPIAIPPPCSQSCPRNILPATTGANARIASYDLPTRPPVPLRGPMSRTPLTVGTMWVLSQYPPPKHQARQRCNSLAGFALPLLGSNQEPSDPESDALPVELRGS